MSNVDWLLILYALLFGGAVLGSMIGLVCLEVWLLQQATKLVGRCCRWWHNSSATRGSAIGQRPLEAEQPVPAVPAVVPHVELPGERSDQLDGEPADSGQAVFEFEPDWTSGSDSASEFGEEFEVDSEEPVERSESDESEFQPILTSAKLDVYPERLRYHAEMLKQVGARASPLLKASIENNIACCFAHVGDIRAAATIFRQARNLLLDEPTLYDVTLAGACLANMRELVGLGVPGIAEQLAGLEEFLENVRLDLFQQRVIDLVNANLDRALARLSGR